MSKFSRISTDRKNSCHVDLQILADEVIKIHDCTVVTGYRDERTQNQLYVDGFSSKEKMAQ